MWRMHKVAARWGWGAHVAGRDAFSCSTVLAGLASLFLPNAPALVSKARWNLRKRTFLTAEHKPPMPRLGQLSQTLPTLSPPPCCPSYLIIAICPDNVVLPADAACGWLVLQECLKGFNSCHVLLLAAAAVGHLGAGTPRKLRTH